MNVKDPTDSVTLTDRYVWTVTRHLPPDTGPDVASELRGTIEEMVEAKIRAGADAAAAEELALTELGDPDVLAREYGGRPGFLIGPGLYPEYVRLLKLLMWIVLPIAFVGTFLTRTFATDERWAQALLDSLLLLLSIGVHVAFWTTVAFAFVDRTRSEADRDKPLNPWSTDQLPTEGPWRQVKAVDFGFSVFFILLVIALVVWQFSGVSADGPGIQVLDPALWIGWKILIVGFLAIDLVLQFAVWHAGRWTATLAAVNVLSNAGAVAVGLWLVQQEQLVVPDLPQRLADEFGGSAEWTVSNPMLAAIVLLFPLWDSVDTVRRARNARRVETPPAG